MLQQIGFRFKQDVAAYKAAIGDSMFDINRHISGFNEDETIAPRLVFDRQPAREMGLIGKSQAGAGQQSERFGLQPAFRDRDRQVCQGITSRFGLIKTLSPRSRFRSASRNSTFGSSSIMSAAVRSASSPSLVIDSFARIASASASRSSTKPTAGSAFPKFAVN